MRRLLSLLRADTAGSMAIETAIVAPVLALMSIGAFQVSALVARQQEIQSGAAQAASIAMAATPDDQAKIDTIKGILESQLGVTADQITITKVYRCNSDDDYVDAFTDCASGDIVASYLRITVDDTYQPGWVDFGIGAPIQLHVVRTVQYS